MIRHGSTTGRTKTERERERKRKRERGREKEREKERERERDRERDRERRRRNTKREGLTPDRQHRRGKMLAKFNQSKHLLYPNPTSKLQRTTTTTAYVPYDIAHAISVTRVFMSLGLLILELLGPNGFGNRLTTVGL